jgi:predicted nucleic acid-binding protein
MGILIDTSVLGRLANLADSSHAIAKTAIAELHSRGEVLHITPQNLIEFRGVATRPVSANGLGLATLEAEKLAATFEAAFALLRETPDIYPAWKGIVGALGVVGKQVHDARLVAVCHVHAVTHLLRFNIGHFARMAGLAPGVIVLDPASV